MPTELPPVENAECTARGQQEFARTAREQALLPQRGHNRRGAGWKLPRWGRGPLDDVSLLLSALASGAAYNDAEGIGHGGSERGGQVVAVAYNALREAVAERLAGDRAGEVALAEHAADPETWRSHSPRPCGALG